MPPRPVLCGLLLLATLPPFVAQASGSVIGAYTMFNRIERYHLELATLSSSGARRVSLRELAPHLSPEARTILLPAEGYAIGADQVDVVAVSLPALARLACDLHPEALEARATLSRDPFDATRRSQNAVEIACRAQR